LYVLFIGFCAVSSLAAAKMPYCTLNKLINWFFKTSQSILDYCMFSYVRML
jgi:hypothetical protein